MNWYLIIISAAALQGLLLAIAIRKVALNKKSVRWLSALLIAISICLAGRIFYNADLFSRYPKAVVISDLMLFTYGPLILFYVQSIFFVKNNTGFRTSRHFLVAFLHVAWISQYLLVSNQETISMLSLPFHLKVGQITEALGWCHIAIYLIASYLTFQKYLEQSKSIVSNLPAINFLKYFFTINAMALTLWVTGYLLLKFNGNPGSILFTYNSIWILLTCSVYMTGYYAIAIPDFFRIDLKGEIPELKTTIDLKSNSPSKKSESNYKDSPPDGLQIADTYATELVNRLKDFMESDKPFLDPNLTLPLLSTKLSCTIHLLSKVINESYEKNFFDFVNEYRVNYFIRLAKEPSNKKYTLLSLAFESGFNSKSTFNQSFKKATNMTPSQFLKSMAG